MPGTFSSKSFFGAKRAENEQKMQFVDNQRIAFFVVFAFR